MTRNIKHEFFYPHPPEVVWEYLTRSDLMEQWLMKNDFQPVVGLDFTFRTGPVPTLDFDGTFHCRVLEIVPNRKLSYSWNAGPGGGEITMESVVTWILERKEKGTSLHLDHSGFSRKENLEFYNRLLHGWLEKFDNIAGLLKVDAHVKVNA